MRWHDGKLVKDRIGSGDPLRRFGSPTPALVLAHDTADVCAGWDSAVRRAGMERGMMLSRVIAAMRLAAGVDPHTLDAAMAGHVLAPAQLVATYKKQ